MKINCTRSAIASLLLMAVPTAGISATATGRMNVRVTIQASCELVSASDLDFGNATTMSSTIDQVSTLTVKCSNTTPYNVGLGVGTGGGTVASRRMAGSGGEYVTYGLYRDSARTQLWGETIGTDTATATGTGANQSMTVYGRVNVQGVPTPGSYSDVVTVTITY